MRGLQVSNAKGKNTFHFLSRIKNTILTNRVIGWHHEHLVIDQVIPHVIH